VGEEERKGKNIFNRQLSKYNNTTYYWEKEKKEREKGDVIKIIYPTLQRVGERGEKTPPKLVEAISRLSFFFASK